MPTSVLVGASPSDDIVIPCLRRPSTVGNLLKMGWCRRSLSFLTAQGRIPRSIFVFGFAFLALTSPSRAAIDAAVAPPDAPLRHEPALGLSLSGAPGLRHTIFAKQPNAGTFAVGARGSIYRGQSYPLTTLYSVNSAVYFAPLDHLGFFTAVEARRHTFGPGGLDLSPGLTSSLRLGVVNLGLMLRANLVAGFAQAFDFGASGGDVRLLGSFELRNLLPEGHKATLHLNAGFTLDRTRRLFAEPTIPLVDRAGSNISESNTIPLGFALQYSHRFFAAGVEYFGRVAADGSKGFASTVTPRISFDVGAGFALFTEAELRVNHDPTVFAPIPPWQGALGLVWNIDFTPSQRPDSPQTTVAEVSKAPEPTQPTVDVAVEAPDLDLSPGPQVFGQVRGRVVNDKRSPINARITWDSDSPSSMQPMMVKGPFVLRVPAGRHQGIVKSPGYFVKGFTVDVQERKVAKVPPIVLRKATIKRAQIVGDTIQLQRPLTFKMGSNILTKPSFVSLDEVVDLLLNSTTLKIRLVSYGILTTEGFNGRDAAQKRANRVKAYLQNAGVQASRIEAVGQAESVPPQRPAAARAVAPRFDIEVIR